MDIGFDAGCVWNAWVEQFAPCILRVYQVYVLLFPYVLFSTLSVDFMAVHYYAVRRGVGVYIVQSYYCVLNSI